MRTMAAALALEPTVRHTAFPARPRWPIAAAGPPSHNNNSCALSLRGGVSEEASRHCLGPCTLRIVYTGNARVHHRAWSSARDTWRASAALTGAASAIVTTPLACPVCHRPGLTIVRAREWRGHKTDANNMMNLRRHTLLRKRAPQHGDAKHAPPSATSLTQVGRRRSVAGAGNGGHGKKTKRGTDDGTVGYETRQLVWACHNGHARRVGDLLRSRDVDIDFRGEHGWSPMLHACHHGCVEIVS